MKMHLEIMSLILPLQIRCEKADFKLRDQKN